MEGIKTPEPPEDDIEFVDPEDDTPENREIVRIAEERWSSNGPDDLELAEVAEELGIDLADS
jgi:hypothetical protein